MYNNNKFLYSSSETYNQEPISQQVKYSSMIFFQLTKRWNIRELVLTEFISGLLDEDKKGNERILKLHSNPLFVRPNGWEDWTITNKSNGGNKKMA